MHSKFNMAVWLPLYHMFHISECRTLIVYFYCKRNKTFLLYQMIFLQEIFLADLKKKHNLLLSFCGVHWTGSVNVSMRLVNFTLEKIPQWWQCMHLYYGNVHVFQGSDCYYIIILHIPLHHLILMEIPLYFKWMLMTEIFIIHICYSQPLALLLLEF